jgi:hypothetical protein
MLERLVTATIVFLSLTTIAAGIADAQSRDRIQLHIPFTFVLQDHTLPAGDYVVERTDPGRPNILTLKNVDKRIVRLILMQRVEKNVPSTASSLMFIQRQGKLYLFQVWNVGSVNGAQVPSAFAKQTSDRRRQSFTLVTLKVEDP